MMREKAKLGPLPPLTARASIGSTFRKLPLMLSAAKCASQFQSSNYWLYFSYYYLTDVCKTAT